MSDSNGEIAAQYTVKVLSTVGAIASLAPPPGGTVAALATLAMVIIYEEITGTKALTFEDIQPKIQEMINTSLDERDRIRLKDQLEGILKALKDYKLNLKTELANGEAGFLDFQGMSSQLNTINTLAVAAIPSFLGQSQSSRTRLAIFPLVPTLAATHFQILHELSFYPDNSVDELGQMQERANDYLTALQQVTEDFRRFRTENVTAVEVVKHDLGTKVPAPRFSFRFKDNVTGQTFTNGELVRDSEQASARSAMNRRRDQHIAELMARFASETQPIRDAWEPVRASSVNAGGFRTEIWVQNRTRRDLRLMSVEQKVRDGLRTKTLRNIEAAPQVVPAGELLAAYVVAEKETSLARRGSIGALTWADGAGGTIRLEYDCTGGVSGSVFGIPFGMAEASATATTQSMSARVNLKGRVGDKYQRWTPATQAAANRLEVSGLAGRPFRVMLAVG